MWTILGVVLFLLSIRASRCAIHVEEDGIRVVNPVSSRRLAWDEIKSFTLARCGIVMRTCVIELVDGTRQCALGIVPRNPNFFKDAVTQRMIAELNELLRQSRANP